MGSASPSAARALRGIVRTGPRVIFISHDIGEAREMADRTTVLRDAEVAAHRDALGASLADFVERIVGPRPARLNGSRHPGARRFEPMIEVRGAAGARPTPPTRRSGGTRPWGAPASSARAATSCPALSFAPGGRQGGAEDRRRARGAACRHDPSPSPR